MSHQLSFGAVKAMYQGDSPKTPVLQIIDVKQIQSTVQAPSNQPNRYRLVISDGHQYQQAMLATQLNSLIDTNTVGRGCIVKLNDYICNTVQERRIVIVLALEVVSGPVQNIGSPTNVEVKDADKSGQQGLQQGQRGPSAQQPPQHFSGQQQQAAYPPQNFQGAPPAPNRAPVQGQQAPQRQFQQRAAVASPQGQAAPADMSNIHPIKSLNPYQNRWTIKARITNKGQIRTWNNQRGPGKLFSIDLLDASGGEIKATFFNDAVDKFYPILEADKVYLISKGLLKLANKQYNTTNNEYELNLNADTQIQLCMDEADDIPKLRFNFIKIQSIKDCEANSIIDVVAIAWKTGPFESITSRAGNQVNKRTITLLDDSLATVDLTLWGSTAENPGWADGETPVVAIKGARVSTFNNKTLSAASSSVFEVNPDIYDAHAMRGWFDTSAGQISDQISVLSTPGAFAGGEGRTERKTIEQGKADAVGHKEKSTYFEIKACVTAIKHEQATLWYRACPSEKCSKKVEERDGQFYCITCDRIYPNFEMRYILSFAVADHTASAWLSSFNEVGQLILGKPADQLAALQDADLHAFSSTFSEAQFKQYIFKVRAKEEEYNEAWRVRCSVISAVPVDFVKEGYSLLKGIQSITFQ